MFIFIWVFFVAIFHVDESTDWLGVKSVHWASSIQERHVKDITRVNTSICSQSINAVEISFLSVSTICALNSGVTDLFSVIHLAYERLLLRPYISNSYFSIQFGVSRSIPLSISCFSRKSEITIPLIETNFENII